MAQLTVTARLVGPTLFAAKVRGHLVLADLPEEMGGTDVAPLPPEILLASLAECFGMVAALHCRDRGIPCRGMSVTVCADKGKDENGAEYWTSIKMHVRLPEEVDEQRVRAIMRHASLACSVRGTIIREQDVTVTTGPEDECEEAEE